MLGIINNLLMVKEFVTMQKKVLIACLADPSRNPRPRRAIELCKSMGMSVSILSYPPKEKAPLKGESFFYLPNPSYSLLSRILKKILLLGVMISPLECMRIFFESLRWDFRKILKKMSKITFDLIIIEDIHLLPFFILKKNRGKVVFDAREYYPKQNEESYIFNISKKRRRVQLCQKYMPKCDAVLTVSEGLRRAYKKEFGISSVLYRSTPYYTKIPVRFTKKEHIKMVYHGGANKNRQLENLIEIMGLLDDRFSLDFFLVGDPSYQYELEKLAYTNPRIRFMKPVPFNEIIPTMSRYDIGLFYCEPSTFNLRHCLPNKFFEYIQARAMIAIGPSPDMAELVNKYGCGVVSQAFSVESMAEALNGLSVEDIDRAKRCSDIAARDLCFEEESKVMRGIVRNLIGE